MKRVVISKFGFGAAKWLDESNVAFENFVSGGGGLVIVHAADNSFGDWQQYIYLDDSGQRVIDNSPGSGGSHGVQHEFEIVIRDKEHPIMLSVSRHTGPSLRLRDAATLRFNSPCAGEERLNAKLQGRWYAKRTRRESFHALSISSHRAYFVTRRRSDFALHLSVPARSFQSLQIC